MEIISLIFIAVIAFLPILIWGYIFSYLDNSVLNTRRFSIGIVAGVISVVPVLYLESLLGFFSVSSFNIFPLLTGSGNTMDMILSFSIMVAMIAWVIFITSFGVFFGSTTKSWILFLKNLGIILLFGLVYSLFHRFVFALPILDIPVKNGGVMIGWAVFSTVKLVLFYYLVIGIIEETSKHFSMVTSSASAVDSVKKWVLFSVFIALGFGFIENILYLKNIANTAWALDSSLFSTWIFRSIFSLMVHILSSVIVALYFSRALLSAETKGKIFSYAKVFATGFLFSIILHAIFDISLTVGFTGIIFVYFFFGYLGITRVFYKE